MQLPGVDARVDRLATGRRHWALGMATALAVLVTAEPALAVVPASFVLGHTPEHTGQGMHGGPPPARYSHHLIVAVFEARGGMRMADASVTAIVSNNRRPVKRVELEPMTLGGAATYGGFVEMPPRDTYRISVEIRRAEGIAPVKAEFWHRHWQP